MNQQLVNYIVRLLESKQIELNKEYWSLKFRLNKNEIIEEEKIEAHKKISKIESDLKEFSKSWTDFHKFLAIMNNNDIIGLWAIDRDPKEVSKEWIEQNAFQIKDPYNK